MKVGIDASWACGNLTGTGRFTIDLVDSLTALLSSNEYVLYFRKCCVQSNPLYTLARDNVTKRIVDSGSTVYRILIPLSFQLERDSIDLFLSPAYFLPLFGSRKWIVTFLDFNVYSLAKEWARPGTLKGLVLMRTLFPLSLKKASRVVTISEATQRDLVRLFPPVAEKSSVIYPGFDPQRFGRPDVTARKENPPRPPLPYVLYVGNLSPTKNLERMILAFSNFSERGGGYFHLVIAGRDVASYGSNVLWPLAKRLGVEEKVKFYGYVSDDFLASLYSGASCLFYPSLYEGFGYPILEAHFFNVPVVTSNTSSCPEVGGDAALYVDPMSETALCEALVRVTHDTLLRARLVSAGRDRWKAFSLEAMATHYLRLIREAGES